MPFIDADALGTRTLRSDVCILGAGPAGVGVASALHGSGRSVLVVESGGAFLDRHERRNALVAMRSQATGAQSATRGALLGHPYYPLRLSRARGIGGTTAALMAHGLRSRPMDAIDFGGLTAPAWPIDHDEVARVLDRAAAICGLPDTSATWDADPGIALLGDGAGAVAVEFRHGARSSVADHADRLAAGDQQWITGATATRLRIDGSGHVDRVDLMTGTGASIAVEADVVVVAAGGIDNPRMLLANPSLMDAMGPSADHVGRYFMEHLHYAAGHIVPASSASFDRIYDEFCDLHEERWVTLDDDEVRRTGRPRSVFIPIPANSGSLAPGVQAFGRLARSLPYGPFARDWWRRDLGDVWQDRRLVLSSIADRVRGRAAYDGFVLGAMSEQRPNRNSRVLLSERVDRYGMPLADLDWQIDGDDVEAAASAASHIGHAFEDAGLGHFVSAWSDGRVPAIEGGWHHMGTTRMSLDPEDGVVDPDCRVHGLANLYVAGSSVFPTGGFANPTLTLVALALRLGDHLASAAPTGEEARP